MFNRKIENDLLLWKNKDNRKPLILRGARQVGKTSTIKKFSDENFEYVIYINLDNLETKELFQEIHTLRQFEQLANNLYKTKIEDHKTIVIIDEIQNCPNLIKLLRSFYENRPSLHVISAGSLLEVQINKQGFEFPVGRVEYLYMFPMDFFEYLEASKHTNLRGELLNFDLDSEIHESTHLLAMNKFYEYLSIGGMPQVVDSFLKTKSHTDVEKILSSLLTGYSEDVSKYSSVASSRYLQFIIDTAPNFSGGLITYENFGQSKFKGREMRDAFTTLEKAMIVNQLEATASTSKPIISKSKRPKKLIFLDSGFVNYKADTTKEIIAQKPLEGIFRGRLAEQIVGQTILSLSTYDRKQLYYWARPKSESSAEVDFCLTHNGKIVGIEVKAGSSSHLKSLMSFSRLVNDSVLIRINSEKPKIEKLKITGENKNLISIPFYLVSNLFKILDAIL